MNLYHVQDGDRPMWVLANDYGEAVMRWKMLIANENSMPLKEVEDPQGVKFVCDADELILPGDDK